MGTVWLEQEVSKGGLPFLAKMSGLAPSLVLVVAWVLGWLWGPTVCCLRSPWPCQGCLQFLIPSSWSSAPLWLPEVTPLSAPPPNLSVLVAREWTQKGQRQAVPTWCYVRARKLPWPQEAKRCFTVHRENVRNMHHTLSVGSKSYPHPIRN